MTSIFSPVSSSSLVFKIFSLLLLVVGSQSEIAVISKENDTVAVFFDVELGLGGPLPTDGIAAYVAVANPENACEEVIPPPIDVGNNSTKWFILVRRFGCSFLAKMKYAMKAGYEGMIVYNVETANRKNFTLSHFAAINAFEGIPAVLISNDDGMALKNKFVYDKGYYIIVTSDFPQNLISYLLPFALVIGICLLIMISFMIIKCVRDRQKSRRHRLSSKHLKKLPTTKFKKGDHYDTCAICLEEYTDGEKLRVLPCGHVYHLKCIDPWLTKNRRVCPVCKAKVVIPGMTETDSESEAEPNVAANERTPLIPEARGRGRRQRRRRRREGQTNEGNSGQETDQVTSSSIDVTNSSRYYTQEEGLPSTSGNLSINCDVREGEEQQHTATASSEHPSASLTTSVVVSVEVEPENSSSRGRRRSDAIV